MINALISRHATRVALPGRRQSVTSDPRPGPFRWNIRKREQLGRLLDGQEVDTYPEFYTDLRTVTAKVLARAGDSELVFLGRSAENLFDYLSGLFHDATPPLVLKLLQFSCPPHDVSVLARRHPAALNALLDSFRMQQLDPASIAGGSARIRYIDLVNTGASFTILFSLIKHWCRTQAVDWKAIRPRLGFIGITARGKNSPNTWRWHQRRSWVAELERSNVKNVSIPIRQWTWIGNHDEKATPSHNFERWALPDGARPDRDERYLKGLRLAARLFDHGRDRLERARFAKQLAGQPEMKQAWLRARVLRLKSS